MKIIYFLLSQLILLTAFSCSSEPQPTPGPEPSDPKIALDPVPADPFSWVALAPDGTWMDNYQEYKEGKTVGIFYFVWFGCHGYDNLAGDNQVHYPTASDTRSPYNNEEIYKQDPEHPKTLPFGPYGAFHHWGEPYLGYYLSDDAWVYRKHAQLLSDAGVDAVFLDATNGYHYVSNAKIMCNEWTKLRENGCNTPQFGYLFNTNANTALKAVYNTFYSKDYRKDLWFMWEGKPLVLAKASEVDSKYKSMFTFRHSWFTYNLKAYDKWYDLVNGKDCLPYGGWYPQKPGYHGGALENISVMAGSFPLDNIGRSFDYDTWTEPAVPQSEKGIHFYKQLDYALSQNPQFLFFTGWNEWVAQRQQPSENLSMLGMSSVDFGGAFVDNFNHEFSRDLEPLRGGFGDTYYYYLIDAVRRFKGAKSPEQFDETAEITLDGYALDWKNVQASFGDDRGDATEHKHVGYGRIGMLTNHAQNDIELCKVATDGKNVFFYVQTSAKITASTGNQWMKLFIGVSKSDPAWEGFNFAVQRVPSSGNEVALEKSNGGYSWTKVGTVKRAIGERIIEICIPLESLGISDSDDFYLDFKWIDDTCDKGDIQTCLSDGDSAPNGRFRYRYIHKK